MKPVCLCHADVQVEDRDWEVEFGVHQLPRRPHLPRRLAHLLLPRRPPLACHVARRRDR